MATDYIELLKNIQNQKCALVLGPLACLTEDGKTTFALKVAGKVQGAAKPVKYYAQDDLYFIKERTDRTWASNLIQDEAALAIRNLNKPGFYQPLFKHLTELPFHFILNLSPDNFLFRWMQHEGIEAQFASFSINDPTSNFEKPTPSRPLIFNLLGEISKAESLILTQEDFYKYLSEVFTNPKKLEDLRKYLRDIDYLLFIGVPLDRWYVKLLMLLFDINSDSRFITLATNPKRDNFRALVQTQVNDPELMEFEDFCCKHYKVTFVENSFLEFMDELYRTGVTHSNIKNPIVTLRKTTGQAAKKPSGEIIKQSVSISFAPDEKSLDIAFKISQILETVGYEVLNEKISLGYRGNLRDFIKKMGAGKAVITILSDSFLKDKNCMSLALEMQANTKLVERIFPIVLDDANIYDAARRLRYIKFWQDKIDELNRGINDLPDKSYLNKINEELNQYSEIKRYIDEFMGVVKDMNVLTPDIHKGENFGTLIKDINTQFEKDLKKK